jgi:hypothetical protein
VTEVTDKRRRGADDGAITTSKESSMFKTNVGAIDRIARILAGLVLLGLAVTGSIGAWGYIGLVPLATGLLGSCPLYSVLGFSTCPMKG